MSGNGEPRAIPVERFLLRAVGRTDVGAQRTQNEDAMYYDDFLGVYVVCDGMGGHASGQVASDIAIRTIVHAIKTGEPAPAPGQDPLVAAMKAANAAVFQRSLSDQACHGMGTTAVGIRFEEGLVHICHCGDSRAYLLREGRLVQVTRDQSYVQALVDAGALAPHEAATSPFRNIILQAMGQEPDVQVALGKLSLRQRDCFILCSDGLTNKVTPEQMTEVILTAPRMDVACARLIALANEHGGEDNITVVMGGVSGDLPATLGGERISDTLERLQEFVPAVPPSQRVAGRG